MPSKPALRHLLVFAAVAGPTGILISTATAEVPFGLVETRSVPPEVQERLRNLPKTAQRGVSVGPDVTVINLSGFSNYTDFSGDGGPDPCPPGYGAEDCRGYALGTDSCNIGSVPVDWCDQTSGCRTTTDEFHPLVATDTDHSVISQNLYRLKDGRFEQIGMSFLKHGFLSVNSSDAACAWNDGGEPNTSCVSPPFGGDQLGLGCTDFYGSGLNGGRPMGRRSDVNPANGAHPANGAGGESNDDYDQRIVVPESDLDPAQNPGALYWGEAQYTVRDDARAGNGLNNASHRRVVVGALPDLDLDFTGPTVRELPAIFAWQAEDPAVEIAAVDRLASFTGEPASPPATGQTHPDHQVVERFHVARRVTGQGGPLPHHLEYVVHNLNSDAAAEAFAVKVPEGTTLGGAGFHGLPHHSGEPYDTSDWTIDADGPNGVITWTAVDAGANTNALRWGTSFTFWFDADELPLGESISLFAVEQVLAVPLGPAQNPGIFADGFESGDITQWTGGP